MTVLNIPAAPAEPRRDRWGRYLINQADGAKPIGYSRATTIAKALDDTSNLMDWACRMTALGLAQRPDLLALVQATDDTDKKTLNGIVGRAKEAGGATARRDLGTALHALIEKSHADPTFKVPDLYAADVAAVNKTIAALGLEVIVDYSEVVVVLDRHQIAGTADLILRNTATGELIVADIKTGSSVKYGALGFAIQLSIYANADNIYRYGETPAADQRLPMPEGINRHRALILHVEPSSGVCTPHWLDIARGAAALETAMAVRTWRKEKNLLTVATVERPAANAAAADVPVDEAGTAAVTAVPANPTGGEFHEQRARWIDQRIDDIKTAGHLGDVAKRWPEGVAKPKAVRAGHASWSHDDIDAIAAACQWVETRHQLAFGEIDPKVTAERLAERAAANAEKAAAKQAAVVEREHAAAAAKVEARKARPAADDDAAQHPVKADLVAGLRAELRAEPRRIQQQVIAWSKEATEAGVGWSMGRAKEVPMRSYVASSCALALARLDRATLLELLVDVRVADELDGRQFLMASTVGVLLGTLDPFVCDDLLAAATHAHLGTTETVTAEAA